MHQIRDRVNLSQGCWVKQITQSSKENESRSKTMQKCKSVSLAWFFFSTKSHTLVLSDLGCCMIFDARPERYWSLFWAALSIECGPVSYFDRALHTHVVLRRPFCFHLTLLCSEPFATVLIHSDHLSEPLNLTLINPLHFCFGLVENLFNVSFLHLSTLEKPLMFLSDVISNTSSCLFSMHFFFDCCFQGQEWTREQTMCTQINTALRQSLFVLYISCHSWFKTY